MGRIGETVRRTFQLAHVMKAWRRSEAAAGIPACRRIRASTIPTIVTTRRASCATSPRSRSSRRSPTAWPAHVGSLQPGRLADLVMWKPGFFGVKPEWVFKGGFPAWGPIGRATRRSSARSRPAIGRTGRRAIRGPEGRRDVRFDWRGPRGARATAGDAKDPGADRRRPRPDPTSLHANRAAPAIDIDVRTGAVSLGGVRLAVDPVTDVPLSRRYLLR